MNLIFNASMGKRMIQWTAALMFLAAAGPMLQAQQSFGVIDLQKVFDGYYKTKQADVQIKERAGDAEKVLKGMMEDYQAATEEYQKLTETANDAAISAAERSRRKKAAEDKMAEIKDIEQSVTQYRRTAQSTIDEQRRRMRDKILVEIREVINTKARGKGYTLVLDTAALSVNQTPIILYSAGQNDLTEEVLQEINATAPKSILDETPSP